MIYLINGTTETAVEYLITANHSVDLDGADTLAATFGIPYVDLVDDNTTVRFNGQLYTITSYTKDMIGESPTCMIQCEHISYELNDPQYNLQAFALMGTPEEILTAALVGTPYTVGTVEPTDVKTVGIMEEATRRAIIWNIALLCGGELTYSEDGRTVNLLNHRGSVTAVNPFELDTVVHVSYTRDKLQETTSFAIETGKKSTLQCGDNIYLPFEPYGLDTNTRIIAMSYNPYNPFEVSIEVGDHIPDIIDSFVEDSKKVEDIIQTFSVSEGQFISRIEVEQLISSIEQSADRIGWLVQSGTGISSFVLTPEMLELVSQNIRINGFVTFANLEETGTTSINGSYIKTNHLIGQSEETELELDAPTSGGEITATVSYNTSLRRVTVTFSAASLESRTMDLVGVLSTGGRVSFQLTMAAGQTTINSVRQQTFTRVYFGLTGDDTWVFSDGDSFGIACRGDFVPMDTSTGSTTGYQLGTSAKKWKIGYIFSGVVTGSARKYKKDIRDLNSKHIKFFDALRPVSFLFRNGESGRRHYGFIVDEVKNALDSSGLTSADCAAYCLDDPEDMTGGGGLRYEEFIPVLTAKIKQLELRITELEGTNGNIN